MLEKDVFRLVTSVYLAIRIREIVCFELDKEIEKDVVGLVTSVRQRKNSESP